MSQRDFIKSVSGKNVATTLIFIYIKKMSQRENVATKSEYMSGGKLSSGKMFSEKMSG